MSYTIAPEQVIDYPPERLRELHGSVVEYIDNRVFMLDPGQLVGEPAAQAYRETAAGMFTALGWQGDGRIELLWLPAFVFPLSEHVADVGVGVWHVKQDEDGISYLLSPLPMPFEALHNTPHWKEVRQAADRRRDALGRAVDEVLHYVWDPIGIQANPDCRGEYAAYADRIESQLLRGAGEQELCAALAGMARNEMGVNPDAHRTRRAAAALVAWRASLRD